MKYFKVDSGKIIIISNTSVRKEMREKVCFPRISASVLFLKICPPAKRRKAGEGRRKDLKIFPRDTTL